MTSSTRSAVTFGDAAGAADRAASAGGRRPVRGVRPAAGLGWLALVPMGQGMCRVRRRRSERWSVPTGANVIPGPWGRDDAAEATPPLVEGTRRRITFRCDDGHDTNVVFGPAGSVPDVWDCRWCGVPAQPR